MNVSNLGLVGWYYGPAAHYRMKVIEFKKRRAVIEFKMRTDERYGRSARRRAVPVSEIRLDRDAAEALAKELTGDSLCGWITNPGHYRPTIRAVDAAHILLADEYDRAQSARCDPRRAWRGVAEEKRQAAGKGVAGSATSR